PDYEYAQVDELLEKDNPLLVILDHIEDPHNLGAIVRTCEAAGVDGIIIPKNRSVEVTSTVMRTSVGALDYVKIARVTNLRDTMEYLKKKGFWIVGTDMNGTDYQEIDYRGKMALVIGSEGFGMARLVKEHCDFIASIPMNGKVNSLNASVAAGIIIYEAISKRK
ncbi:MAG: 23S rRNA (guanosine(2251)-2'-O)-methyltransferase RlmB, partial [Firmicutes bacterium]|nr:23S rRNA (guanosine(2251)-2'-O)-methyltransferase RlmB [Bacillota bacterium]